MSTVCYFTGIGVIVAVITMFYNNWQANRRETRKEVRNKLDQLDEKLEALKNAANNYYLDKNAVVTKEIANIHGAINACDRLINWLIDYKKPLDLQSNFYLLYDLVTGDEFESSRHKADERFSALCKKISTRKEIVIEQAEQWYTDTFQ